MAFSSISELLNECNNESDLFETIISNDAAEQAISHEESFSKMSGMWKAMKDAFLSYDENERSASGLAGGDGSKCLKNGENSIGGIFLSEIISNALKMGESNACMKRIVAAPTAGSCGVIPAVLKAYQTKFKVSDEKIIKALYIAAAFGQIIATRASISGAEGGCQAEIGAASAMAAAAAAYLHGGDAQSCAHACAMALKNLLGLICDPVAGLVEVPCIKRNTIGATNAVVCADMALAGIKSKIPPDEVIDALGEVGLALPKEFRETAKGGLAATPFAQKIKKGLNISE